MNMHIGMNHGRGIGPTLRSSALMGVLGSFMFVDAMSGCLGVWCGREGMVVD